MVFARIFASQNPSQAHAGRWGMSRAKLPPSPLPLELCLTSSLQPAPKDKPKLGDSLPQNAINPHSSGWGCTDLFLHLQEGLEAGAGSRWDQGKGLVGQNPSFSTPNLL